METVREPLVTYIVAEIDHEHLNFHYEFFALNMTFSLGPMVLDLVRDVLSRCSEIKSLALPSSWPVDDLLSAVNPSLWCSQIHIICLDSHLYKRTELRERELLLQIRLDKLKNPLEVLPLVLEYCYCAKRGSCIDVHETVHSKWVFVVTELLNIAGDDFDVKQSACCSWVLVVTKLSRKWDPVYVICKYIYGF